MEVPESENPLSASDSFRISYPVGAFLFLLYAEILLYWSRASGDEAVFLLWIIGPSVFVFGAWFCLVFWNLIKWRWRSVASLFAAPVIGLLTLVALEHLGLDGDWLRFEYRKSDFLKNVADSAISNGHPVLIHWRWGDEGGAFGYPRTLWTLVYDETDQLALPTSTWPNGLWSKKLNQNTREDLRTNYTQGSGLALPNDGISEPYVTRLGGHFYLAEQTE